MTFASYTNKEVLAKEVENDLQQIFNNRVNIWNKLMVENISLDDIQMQLGESISEPLITNDMEIFEDILNNPTSYETILDVDIQDCEIIKITRKKGVFLVKIAWTLEGYEDMDYEEVEYDVDMIRKNNRWLLSDYKPRP